MNDELRQRVIQALQRGEDLPSDWARELFPPEKREYELTYYGKEREEDIIAGTMAVPLQAERTFGRNGVDWHNMLIFGDNLQVMKTLLEQKKAGKLCNADGTPGVRLIYIDPPFATKREFSGSQDQKAYQDRVAGAQFVEFLRRRLVLLRELLANNGSLFVHLDQKKGHYIKVVLDEVFGENNFRNEIIVRRTQKNYLERDYISSLNVATDILYVYARSTQTQFAPVFKDEAIAETWHSLDAPNWSGTRPNLIYELFGKMPPKGRCWAWSPEKATDAIERGDLRPNPRTGKPVYRIPARDKTLCTSLWDDLAAYSFSSGYPTEKSEKLSARVVQMATTEGDLILDAFAGSGTTCAVAAKLGRRWIGIDCGKLAIYTIQKRMLNLKTEIGNKGKARKLQPFTLYNAGLYDFSKLKQLPWADWRFFCLQLFGCKEELHTIGGLQLDGKLKGASVLVFNHHEKPGVGIDEETIKTIHAAVGKKIGRKFYIIAPRGVFGFQQDYIDLDGVRYYAMRVPYSIINELHQREFTALKQPNDEMAVNDTVDSVGFDFIQPPKVKWTPGVNARKGQLTKEAFLKIDKFESRARLRGEDTHGGMETFSMLMLDFDYDGDVFDLDTVFYNHQMEEAGWEARFSAESLGNNVMAVFIDIHGNEAREVIPLTQFSLQPTKPVAKKTKAKAKPKK
ncbi:MAG: site-specific DNA-methyltransferase [Deltaproteobacteria bacterium]|nr:MAG: site-specific DNA-methyltransferase [Deltaproteobacteria bacterium]